MTDQQKALQCRIHAVAYQMLDALDTIVGNIAAAQRPDPAQTATVRRQVANSLALWRVCANAKCRRTRCCRGEPSDCLRYGLPLMPNALVGLLKMRRPRRRRA